MESPSDKLLKAFASYAEKETKRLKRKRVIPIVMAVIGVLLAAVAIFIIKNESLKWVLAVIGVIIIIIAVKTMITNAVERSRESKAFSDRLKEDSLRGEKLYNGQDPQNSEFGFSLEMPIVTPSIPSSYRYLERLRTQEGDALTWEREGAWAMKEVYGVYSVMVDIYQLFRNGEEYKKIYICPYGRDGRKPWFAPQGFYLDNENKAGESEQEKTSSPIDGTLVAQSGCDVSSAEEYKKALSLLAMPTKENIDEAASIMERLASENKYGPAMKWMGEYCENVLEDYKKATEWYKKATNQEA